MRLGHVLRGGGSTDEATDLGRSHVALQHRQRTEFRVDVGVMLDCILLCRNIIRHGLGSRMGRCVLDAHVAAWPRPTADHRVVQRHEALSRRHRQGRERRHDVVSGLEVSNRWLPTVEEDL